MLKSQQFLDMDKVFQTIIVYFQTFNRQFSFERVWLKLPNFVVINV